ncbi:unnamed protein product [Hymenolepis diminuta]|uniref:Reverse transcriptase domain-containing protein n=1 Tax=Hymenolepis diminuta TaxID=6216 RepID=A0A0R3S899_HYMDI|nr:unnamed protein product [Hymenolepis diminuta]
MQNWFSSEVLSFLLYNTKCGGIGLLKLVTRSKWAAPIVAARKQSGSFRLCSDFLTGLNTALENNQNVLSVVGDIFTVLNSGLCFGKLDLSKAYLQVEVEPERREYLTIKHAPGSM